MVAMLLLVTIKFGVITIIRKMLVEKAGRLRRLLATHALVLFTTLIACVMTGTVPRLELESLGYIGYGVVSAFASYALWRATAANVSVVAVTAQLDDLIAVAVGLVFAGEASQLSWQWGVGTALCFIAGFLVVKMRRPSDGPHEPVLWWILTYSLIWGFDSLVTRYYAVERGESALAMATLWYTGTVIGSTGLRFLLPRIAASGEKAGTPLGWRDWRNVALLAVPMFLAGILNATAHAEVPIVVLRPIHQAAEMLMPLLIGLFIFKERGSNVRDTVASIGLAVAGTGLIARAAMGKK